jgi:hypothetical protein
MNLEPGERVLVGRWLGQSSRAERDPTCVRIEYLTECVLQKLGFSKEGGAWETLFRDPADGRLWERTYPESEYHGGGPPMLIVIDHATAMKKYGPVAGL